MKKKKCPLCSEVVTNRRKHMWKEHPKEYEKKYGVKSKIKEMKKIPVVCHHSHKSMLESDIKDLVRIYPEFQDLMYIATQKLPTYQKDIQLILKKWSSPIDTLAHSFVPPETRRILFLKKYFDEKSKKMKRSSIIHEVGHYYIYDFGGLAKYTTSIFSIKDEVDKFFSSNIKPTKKISQLLVEMVSNEPTVKEKPIIDINTDPRGPHGIELTNNLLFLPHEVGADGFIKIFGPELYSWRILERISANLDKFSNMSRSGKSFIISGTYLFNRLVRFRVSIELGIHKNYKMKVDTKYEALEKLMKYALKLKSLKFKVVNEYIDKFCPLILDYKRTDIEFLPLYEKFLQEIAKDIFIIKILDPTNLSFLGSRDN